MRRPLASFSSEIAEIDLREQFYLGVVCFDGALHRAGEMFVKGFVTFELVVCDELTAILGDLSGIDSEEPAIDVFERQA